MKIDFLKKKLNLSHLYSTVKTLVTVKPFRTQPAGLNTETPAFRDLQLTIEMPVASYCTVITKVHWLITCNMGKRTRNRLRKCHVITSLMLWPHPPHLTPSPHKAAPCWITWTRYSPQQLISLSSWPAACRCCGSDLIKESVLPSDNLQDLNFSNNSAKMSPLLGFNLQMLNIEALLQTAGNHCSANIWEVLISRDT